MLKSSTPIKVRVTSEEETKQEMEKRAHAIVIPMPFQGHLNPSIYLSIKLATKGFVVTFVNTEHTDAQLTKAHLKPTTDIFAKSRESGLDIRYQTVSDGFPLDFDRVGSGHDEFIEGFLFSLPTPIDEFVGKLVEWDDPRPTCLVVDTFLGWGTRVANKYDLVSVSFFTEPALVFTIDYHLDLLLKNGHFGSNDTRKDSIDYIPGVSAIEPSDLPSYFQTKETSAFVHRTVYKGFEDAKRSDIIICNTVQELESKVVSTLQERQPFYAIGPLFHGATFTFSKSLWCESDCLEWLNTKPERSVLYFSIGSLSILSNEEIKEFAQGLLLSKVNFIWVRRPESVTTTAMDYLPVDRGLVVPWCNQQDVLSHPAIGGFLTHCGWNSILESVWASVPMLCYPIFVDQPTNRKFVVDEWKAGINVCENRSTVTKEEVAEKIKFLMNEDSSKGVRSAVKEVKKTMEIAISSNGSLEKNLDLFVQDVIAKTKLN